MPVPGMLLAKWERQRRAAPCAGYEPRRLFNVVQFVMNAPNGRATVTLEDAMQIMYLRYGRQMLDSQARLTAASFACRRRGLASISSRADRLQKLSTASMA